MKKKKKTLLRIFLLPILIIVLLQGSVTFVALVSTGLQGKLEENTIRMDRHTVQNRQVLLENDMVEHWRAVYQEEGWLSQKLSALLEESNTDIQTFLGSDELQNRYLASVFPELTDTLQRDQTSGLFLVLANDENVENAARYHGFFVRDSDPQAKTANNTDLLLERGDKQLSQTYSIPLDTPWSTDFSFEGEGQRAADDFFYQPFRAAIEHMDTSMANLGYWSKPFVLEESYTDNHWMITYSMPLVHDGAVYGVIGSEISVSYLTDYFSVKDLDADLNAGYILMVKKADGQYESIAGKGALYDIVTRNGDTVSLTAQSEDGLYLADGVSQGKQAIYGVIEPLNLYSSNVPYTDTEWVLCGLVTENSIYGLGHEIIVRLLTAIIGALLLAVLLVHLLVKQTVRPVYRLVESVRGGVTGIHAFTESGIQEIDELHEVVEHLTDAQKKTQEQLLEEKERYRIAVESSQDIFFTYDVEKKILEIVNSELYNGVWDCSEHPEYIDDTLIHPSDKRRLHREIELAEDKLDVELRIKMGEPAEYRWASLYGTVIRNDAGVPTRLVGCIHDIQQRKLLEREQQRKQFYDPVTGFYRRRYGLEAIRSDTKKYFGGALLAMEIGHFSKINDQYGLVFGDILLEQLAVIGRQCSSEAGCSKVIGIRAGASQLVLWLPVCTTEEAKKIAAKIRQQFAALTRERYLALELRFGMTMYERRMTPEEGFLQAKSALFAAGHCRSGMAVYEKLDEKRQKEGKAYTFGEVISMGQMRHLSLSSLAINMFDRGGELMVVLDMLALKIREQYSLDNLVITHFDREYLTNSLFYSWQNVQELPDIIHCTGSQYQTYVETRTMQELVWYTKSLEEDPTLGAFALGADGIAFHMTDQGVYSGSLLFGGIEKSVLEDETKRKLFTEIASVIQNRINLQRHDESAQAKTDFLARMSHEIRTPMNGIIGMTEIALKDGQSESRRVDCLRKIRSSSNYLLGLLNDILDMSKIESGKMHLVPGDNDLEKLIKDLDTLLETKITEKKLHYTTEVSLVHTWFVCDELRLHQVLVNLLSNAIKYSHTGGHICLRVTEECVSAEVSRVSFAVSDDGIGIAREKQQLIFKSFEQADDSRQARKQGTGLGLAISSRLVHMMDAEIELESEPQKGSTFSFTIELQPLVREQEMAKELPGEVSFPGRRILVVEDNALNLEIIRTLLEDRGLLVEEAHNGKEAVACMQDCVDGYYDMVFMDIMMPELNGLEATQIIRHMEREYCQQVPIVAMSANAFAEDVKQSLASGMDAHLSKPVNLHKLDETLYRFLEV